MIILDIVKRFRLTSPLFALYHTSLVDSILELLKKIAAPVLAVLSSKETPKADPTTVPAPLMINLDFDAKYMAPPVPATFLENIVPVVRVTTEPLVKYIAPPSAATPLEKRIRSVFNRALSPRKSRVAFFPSITHFLLPGSVHFKKIFFLDKSIPLFV